MSLFLCFSCGRRQATVRHHRCADCARIALDTTDDTMDERAEETSPTPALESPSDATSEESPSMDPVPENDFGGGGDFSGGGASGEF